MDEASGHSIAQPGPDCCDGAHDPAAPSRADFLSYLALTLAAYSEWPLDKAHRLAARLYDQAWRDYRSAGALYGDGHAGLMRWVAEVLVS